MARDEEFADALRGAVAELSARYYRVDLPDAAGDPGLRVMTAIAAGLLDAMPDGTGPSLLRFLGEAAVRDDG